MDPSQNPFRPPEAPTAPPPQPYHQATQLDRPGVVTAAAIIWIVFGGLGILGQLFTLLAGRFSGIVGLLIAIGFLVAGIQSLTGKSKDQLGNGIGAIVIGALSLLVGFAVAGFARNGVVLGLILLQAGAMITSGILALSGRSAYKAWRAGKYM
jgi:hypothetical protein